MVWAKWVQVTWLLSWVLVATPTLVRAQETCHEKFVGCVAKTGNPLDCFSVKNACEGSLISDTRRAALTETVEIERRDGNAYAYMTLENLSGLPIDVGLRSRQFQCPDGTMSEAIFRFRTTIEGKAKARGHGGIVCFGQSDAIVMDAINPILSSVEGAIIYCDMEQKKPIDLKLVADRTITFKTYDDTTGRYVMREAEGADLASFLCTQEQLSVPAVVVEIKNTLRDLTQRAAQALGESPITPSPTISTGPKG